MTMATSISPKDIVSANRLELLQIADAVASEKRVDRATVFAAVEKTVAKAMATRYGTQQDIRATINPDSGEIRVFRHREIVEEVEDPHIQIHLDLARVQDPDAELGGSCIEELPMAELERTGSQAGKQVMHQRVREAERMSQYEEFKDRLGDIITGVVKLAERGNVTVDTQRGEAIMRRDQSIPRENFRIGDRVRALIVEVQNETPGPQVLLSRSSPEFMLKLFAQEVPEVYEGIIEIRAVARDPGSRAKIAVISNNSSIDPVGACVGMRGSRVQTIVNELHGERIDVIPWSANPELFITASLQPARVTEVILHGEENLAEVIVPADDDNQSKAIGRRGQNVRLASKLTGWQISILTEEAYSEREAHEREEQVATFKAKLEVDEQEAMIIASAGFRSFLEIAEAAPEEFQNIDGISSERLASLQEHAQTLIAEETEARIAALRDDGMENELIDFLSEIGLDIDVLEAVAAYKDLSKKEPVVRTLQQFADLSTDEICGEDVKIGNRIRRRAGMLTKFNFPEEVAGDLIRNARLALGDYTEEELFGQAEDDGDDSAEETPPEAEDDGNNSAEETPPEAEDDGDNSAEETPQRRKTTETTLPRRPPQRRKTTETTLPRRPPQRRRRRRQLCRGDPPRGGSTACRKRGKKIGPRRTKTAPMRPARRSRSTSDCIDPRREKKVDRESRAALRGEWRVPGPRYAGAVRHCAGWGRRSGPCRAAARARCLDRGTAGSGAGSR